MPRRPLLAALTAAAVTAALVVPVQVVLAPIAYAEGGGIEGQYIVTMRTDAASRAKARAYAALQDLDGAFAARLSPSQVSRLRRDPSVTAIEQDQIAKITVSQSRPPWGLDRIDQRKGGRSHGYTYRNTGARANVYVIDTGIDLAHPDLRGRADLVYDSVRDGRKGDPNGHGTHVAGIVGGTRYGVAKGVKLHAVRVLDKKGGGAYSKVIAALTWVRKHHKANAVVNLSLGGPKSKALNRAVTRLSNSGVFVVVAAGNDHRDACKTSPAGASAVETVGASTSSDRVAGFSNHGRCVDLYAPGKNITSDLPHASVGVYSGTSMASPFVAGVAALYKSTHGPTTSGKLSQWLHKQATTKKLKKLPRGSHNRLLYSGRL
ncbi:S8 family peptidase [Actinocorallia longicatena]|uniref:Uncharacterized protein n=1 Tax=Actinocorallia longicatena TaxID=111803 RepID=A0ABP6QF43_9ACTN